MEFSNIFVIPSQTAITTVIIMLCFIVVDMITGLLKAVLKRDWQSTKMREGLIGKAGYLIAVLGAYGIGLLLGQVDTLMTASALMLAVTEAGSVVENLRECGVPIPRVITKAINTLKESAEEEAEEG